VLFTVIPFTVIVDPDRVENTPEFSENDEIIMVELTVNWFAVIIWVEIDENILYSVKSVDTTIVEPDRVE
jgi:hypothetical protein